VVCRHWNRTESKGPKIFSVSGHVKRPGNFELPLGTPLSEIIYEHAGGMWSDRKLKAIIPGGASTPVLTADQVDTPWHLKPWKPLAHS
jgi:NADH-quinone oxidoreductase subunit F